jgi:glycerol-3-phosphate dehydrogenase (NAD(P)+)
VRLLASALERARLEAPVITALAHLIEGSMPLEDWMAMVRAKQPPPARFSRPRTWWMRLREWFRRRRLNSEGQ